jgi:hypothetical protein
MPAPFLNRLSGDGKLTCLTCHDLESQCLPERSQERIHNPAFLRGGPYRQRFELCYRCHDDRGFERLNAHDQISPRGEVRSDICLICHQGPQGEGLRSGDNLIWLCRACHPWRPHPSSGFGFGREGVPNHLVAPSEAVLGRMRESEQKSGIALPLDPNTGRIYCATCHDPHAAGVVATARVESGSDRGDRLRAKYMCLSCHDK